jgi:hypothetical protein
MDAASRRKAGHQEVLGETIAKFEFFQQGWNPYSRFLDVDKVDLILRRTVCGAPQYREVQVKFGKLYRPDLDEGTWTKRHKELFDRGSWRFFGDGEFADASSRLYVAYVMSDDDEYRGDFFIFPARDFAAVIGAAYLKGSKREVCISRCRDETARWVVRRKAKVDYVTNESCLDVSSYRRNFGVLRD